MGLNVMTAEDFSCSRCSQNFRWNLMPLLYSEDGDGKFIHNVGLYLTKLHGVTLHKIVSSSSFTIIVSDICITIIRAVVNVRAKIVTDYILMHMKVCLIQREDVLCHYVVRNPCKFPLLNGSLLTFPQWTPYSAIFCVRSLLSMRIFLAPVLIKHFTALLIHAPFYRLARDCLSTSLILLQSYIHPSSLTPWLDKGVSTAAWAERHHDRQNLYCRILYEIVCNNKQNNSHSLHSTAEFLSTNRGLLRFYFLE